MTADYSHPVIFFDGVCNLCNGTVQFIIRNDRKKRFFFSPLQSAAGQAALQHLRNKNAETPDSVILLWKGSYFTRSDAALRIFSLLPLPWRFLYVFAAVPRVVRDFFYDIIARNRYKWFGKKDECMLPAPELSARFLK